MANSQSKFAELDALKATLLELKRSLENISTTELINDTSTSTTTTYSSTKISTLTQGLLRETDASENNAGGKIVRRNAAGNIYATNIYINEPTKAEVTTIKNSLATDKWRFLVRNSDEGMLKSMSIKDFMAGQEIDAYTRAQSDAKYELKSTAYTKTESDEKYLRKVDKIDAYSKIECNATFLKKTDKIDAYAKRESDEKFALKTSLPALATEAKAGIFKVTNQIIGSRNDVVVTEKAVASALLPKVIANAETTFEKTTNKISIRSGSFSGCGLEVGDVIQIVGSDNNNKEFTVEEILSGNAIIVNKVHANGTTGKSLINEVKLCTIKLLTKWYNAPLGLGQGWVNVLSDRKVNTAYKNETGRSIVVSLYGWSVPLQMSHDGLVWINSPLSSTSMSVDEIIPAGYFYKFSKTNAIFIELR